MKTRAGLKYFVNGYVGKHVFASNSSHVPSNTFFDSFGNSKAFHTVLTEN